MALNAFRWVAALLAGALLITVVILRGDRPENRIGEDEERARRVERQGSHAQWAATRLRGAQVLDSVGVLSAAPAGAASLRVLLDDALPAEVRGVYDSLAMRSMRFYSGPEKAGVDIAFVYDTASRVGRTALRRWSSAAAYVLPQHQGDRCSVVVQLTPYALKPRSLARERGSRASAGVLGPCAYYRAFGIPGPGVDAWLRERGWAFVGGGSWREPRESSPPTLARFYGDDNWGKKPWFGESSRAFLAEMSVPGVHCTAGDLASCSDAMLTSRSQRMHFWNGNVLMGGYPSGQRGFWFERDRPLGLRESHLLADMVRTLGPEKFAKFWKSTEPMPVAFERAAGEPLAQWTARWARSSYGEVPPRGPGLTPWAMVMSAAYLSLGLLVAVRVGARRQYV